MRKFIGTFVIVGAVFAAAGMVRGWFRFDADNEPEQVSVELQIDKELLHYDVSAVMDWVGTKFSGDSDSQDESFDSR